MKEMKNISACALPTCSKFTSTMDDDRKDSERMKYTPNSPKAKTPSLIEKLQSMIAPSQTTMTAQPVKVRLINGWQDVTFDKMNIVICNYLYDHQSANHQMWKELERITTLRREYLFYAMCCAVSALLFRNDLLTLLYCVVALVFPAICTIVVLSTENLEGARLWLEYWAIYGLITSVGKTLKREHTVVKIALGNSFFVQAREGFRKGSLKKEAYSCAINVRKQFPVDSIALETNFYHQMRPPYGLRCSYSAANMICILAEMYPEADCSRYRTNRPNFYIYGIVLGSQKSLAHNTIALLRKFKCQKFNNLPYKYPEEGDLPEQRVQRSRPFEHVGIDYFVYKENHMKTNKLVAVNKIRLEGEDERFLLNFFILFFCTVKIGVFNFVKVASFVFRVLPL
ncbi:unnamed protein product [Angiostrongylus costaricensis]|uniref:Transmembrane protein n=1 Tax=Angiostrongylus costaricensis TaxID=334426 RepID=A0A0R3PED2_ANGCS|nr:unnamed protein product [Angiostrongylus costaricensis]